MHCIARDCLDIRCLTASGHCAKHADGRPTSSDGEDALASHPHDPVNALFSRVVLSLSYRTPCPSCACPCSPRRAGRHPRSWPQIVTQSLRASCVCREQPPSHRPTAQIASGSLPPDSPDRILKAPPPVHSGEPLAKSGSLDSRERPPSHSIPVAQHLIWHPRPSAFIQQRPRLSPSSGAGAAPPSCHPSLTAAY